MKTIFAITLISVCVSAQAAPQRVERVSVPIPEGMQRSDVLIWRSVPHPRAVLVFVPGSNGSSEGFVKDPEWQRFAEKQQLGLAGVSFASDLDLVSEGKGYYFPRQGSGKALLDCLRKAYGKELPILMCGFSAGAYFTSRFVEWKPARIISWCAYSAGDWEFPAENSNVSPPGIVACGEMDPWLGASLIYFKQGRAVGKPWLWVSVANTGHAGNPQLNSFIRDYFEAILASHGKLDTRANGVWIDVDREETVDPASEPPSVTGWLPSPRLLDTWRKLHQP